MAVLGTLKHNPTGGEAALAQNIEHDAALYRNAFAPQAERLRRIGLGFDEGNQYAAAQRSIEGAGRILSGANESLARDRIRMGRSVDASTSASQTRRLGLARVIAQVDAGNRAAQSARSTQRTAMEGGIQQYGDLAADSNASLSAIAKAEADREAQYRAAKAQKKSNNLAAIGTAAALALMFV